MPTSRRCLASLALLLGAGACSSGEITTPTAALHQASGRLVLQHVDGRAAGDAPIDATMGTNLSGVLRVRAVDRRGRAAADVPVRFRVGAGEDASLIQSTSEHAHDRAITVQTDADGYAAIDTWVLPARDTVVTAHVVDAQLVADSAQRLQFTANAWRDLSHFGGASPVVIDRLPVARHLVSAILPLGTFGTEDALPSADALLELRASGIVDVHAVADGIVTELDVLQGAVTLRVRDHVRIRVSGVRLRSDVWIGRVLSAGTPIGTSDASRTGARIAVRVLDGAMVRSRWVRPERYGARRNATFFLRYLADSLRSHAFGLVRRASPDLDGRIDYDRDGRLVGTWFGVGAPMAAARVVGASYAFASAVTANASEVDPSAELSSQALTFAYDAERPGQVRIASGVALAGALGIHGVRAVAWEDPDPADVDSTRGIVRYHLYAIDDEVRMDGADRVLLVQLLNAGTLLAEVVSLRDAERAVFSARATMLTR